MNIREGEGDEKRDLPQQSCLRSHPKLLRDEPSLRGVPLEMKHGVYVETGISLDIENGLVGSFLTRADGVHTCRDIADVFPSSRL